MEVITIENQVFSQLLTNIESLTKEIQVLNQNNKVNSNQPLPNVKPALIDEWLDNEDACKLFRVTKRTLQNYRDNFTVPFSQIGKKILYKASDLKQVLEEHYITLNAP
jgi:hypothetical protein